MGRSTIGNAPNNTLSIHIEHPPLTPNRQLMKNDSLVGMVVGRMDPRTFRIFWVSAHHGMRLCSQVNC